MDIRGFVYRLVDYFPGPLKTPARRVADVAFGIWDDLSNVFRAVVPRWKDLSQGAIHFIDRVLDTIDETAKALWNIVSVRLPRAVEAGISAVVSWATDRINDIWRGIQATRDYVLDKARAFANAVYDYAASVYKWAIARLSDVWSTLTIVAKLVNALLTDPKKLAEWAIGAIWTAFWRFANQHVDAIVEFAWQRRSIVVSRLVGRAESILERLL